MICSGSESASLTRSSSWPHRPLPSLQREVWSRFSTFTKPAPGDTSLLELRGEPQMLDPEGDVPTAPATPTSNAQKVGLELRSLGEASPSPLPWGQYPNPPIGDGLLPVVGPFSLSRDGEPLGPSPNGVILRGEESLIPTSPPKYCRMDPKIQCSPGAPGKSGAPIPRSVRERVSE